MKRTIACLAFAIAVVAPSVAQGASPVQGAWQGTQARWNGGNGWKTTLPFPVAFSLKGGTVVGFTETGGNVTFPCSGGQSVAAALPAVGKAKVHGGRFSGKQTKSVHGRKMTTSVSGRFISARRASGKAVTKVQGCPAYKSVWNAQPGQRNRSRPGGGLPPIHIPICHGRNIQMPDGSYFYNSCVYVARKR
jgi:hypothetical protein